MWKEYLPGSETSRRPDQRAACIPSGSRRDFSDRVVRFEPNWYSAASPTASRVRTRFPTLQILHWLQASILHWPHLEKSSDASAPRDSRGKMGRRMGRLVSNTSCSFLCERISGWRFATSTPLRIKPGSAKAYCKSSKIANAIRLQTN